MFVTNSVYNINADLRSIMVSESIPRYSYSISIIIKSSFEQDLKHDKYQHVFVLLVILHIMLHPLTLEAGTCTNNK